MQASLLGPEVTGSIAHRSQFGAVNDVGLAAAVDFGLSAREDVLQPICALAVGKRDEEAVLVVDRHDGVSYVFPGRRPT